MEKPVIKNGSVINMKEIDQAVQEFLDFMDSEDFNEDKMENYEHAIYEAVMKNRCGDNIFEWINSKY